MRRTSKDRLEALRKDLKMPDKNGNHCQWENERKGIDDVRVLREQPNPPVLKWNGPNAYDLNLVAELKHGKLPPWKRNSETRKYGEKRRFHSLRRKLPPKKLPIWWPLTVLPKDEIN